MINYPECDSGGECWFRGNEDRLNESYGSVSYVVSNDENTIDQYDDLYEYTKMERPFPFIITLCHVCDNNSDGLGGTTCSLCVRYMYDKWVTVDNKNYCRYCIDVGNIDEVFSSSSDDNDNDNKEESEEEYDDKLKRILLDYKEYDSKWEVLIRKHISTYEKRIDEEISKIKEKKRKRRKSNGEEFSKWFPQLEDDDIKRLTKKFKSDHIIPKFDKCVDLLEHIIDNCKKK